MKRKKLNLKDLELQLPPIESKENKIILGGNDYSWTITDGIDLDEVVITATSGDNGSDQDDEIDPDWWDQLYDYHDGDDQYEDDYPDDGYGDKNSQSQLEWSVQHPIAAVEAYINSVQAKKATSGMFGQHNGFGDATRHAYWMALNASDFGSNLASQLGVAHEKGSPYQAETDMDLNNNQWGIDFAEGWSGQDDYTFQDFMGAFWDAVQNGEIIIIDQDTIPDENTWGN